MDDATASLPPLEALVDELLGWTAAISQIVEHMHRSQAATGRTEPPIPEVLYDLLCGTLRPLELRHESEVEAAARVVHEAVETLAQEIYLVPVDRPEPMNRAARRARRPRPRRRPR